jgi:hypothetical protein
MILPHLAHTGVFETVSAYIRNLPTSVSGLLAHLLARIEADDDGGGRIFEVRHMA